MKAWEALKAWYYTKVQRTLSTFLGGLAVTDLVAAIISTESYIGQVIGQKGYAVLRIACAAVIFLRAHQKPKV